VDDWTGVLRPDPTSDAGNDQTLATLCGDGAVSQGEQCDGDALAGATCASLGFASGMLQCAQCHFDASRCSFCGNGVINGREECDGTDLGGRTCVTLGFTGGTLGCTTACRLSTGSCDPTFFVPGGGPPGPECLAEWRVLDAAGRPGAAAALGPSATAGNAVTFTPSLDASERCTEPVAIVLPTRGRRPGVRVLRARTTGAGGHPRDLDALKLVCVP